MSETRNWTLHMLAGIVILILLGLHMGIMHLDGLQRGVGMANLNESPVSKQNSQYRDSNMTFTIMMIVLLGVGLYHGLYGLRNILFELTLKPRIEKAVNALLILMGLGLFVLGTWAAVAAHMMAKA